MISKVEFCLNIKLDPSGYLEAGHRTRCNLTQCNTLRGFSTSSQGSVHYILVYMFMHRSSKQLADISYDIIIYYNNIYWKDYPDNQHLYIYQYEKVSIVFILYLKINCLLWIIKCLLIWFRSLWFISLLRMTLINTIMR